MSIENILLILAAGTAAGFINAMAGGGSLLTMPVLIFLGLPSATANGTNRIALLVQNLIGIWNFRSKGFFDWKLGLLLSIPAVIGSLVGASFAVSIPDGLFNKILAVVMIVIVIFVVWQPHKKMANTEKPATTGRKIAASIVFFFVGLYGGFIQAGIGFLMIASMSFIFGMSLVRVNAFKLFVAGLYIFASFFIFVIHGEVNWLLGFILAAGNGIGVWIGSHFAVSKGDKWIRIVLVIAVVLMAGKLFGVYGYLF
ncbi:MAG TPA: sulfite exporter TauE/SafE family protein [Bacillales bacterium]